MLQLAPRPDRSIAAPRPTPGERRTDRETGVDSRIYAEPEDEAWKDAWQTTKELPGRRIRAVGDRSGFPVLDLAPELQQYADRHRAFLHGSPNTAPGVGHWNPLGHRLAGEQIASWMAGWVANPR